MRKKNDFIFYSVPNTDIVAGGSRTRIRNVIQTLKNNFKAFIIQGSGIEKISKALKAPKAEVLYVESATNRLTLCDLICFLIIRKKVERKYIYIRDIYVELFPNEYKTFRKKITAILNKWSYFIYAQYSDVLCFPTKEMAESFYKYHSNFPKRSIFIFPPGTFKIDDLDEEDLCVDNEGLDGISFLYLGGTKYNNSGFDDYLRLSKNIHGNYKFYVISNDLLDIDEDEYTNVIYLHNLSHKEVVSTIVKEKIKYAVHTRPRNKYDDLTFPIKFLDFISCNLPIITLAHSPLKSILSKDYPLFVEDLNEESILRILEVDSHNPEQYRNVKKKLRESCSRMTYKNKLEEILFITENEKKYNA